jgi:hypothetical protein
VNTFLLENGEVVYKNNSTKSDYKQADVGTPDYSDLFLDKYISVIEIVNPMHRMWSDGRWNKLTMAHGCYWGKCTFCDISLDYIKLYEPVAANILCDRMEQLIASATEQEKNEVNYPVTHISIVIADDGIITLTNDGNGIDVSIHSEYGVWIPELIFAHMRTSTNYDKTEKKIVGGKNGFGFKLVLIWSSYGSVETVDHVRGLKYKQEFKRQYLKYIKDLFDTIFKWDILGNVLIIDNNSEFFEYSLSKLIVTILR